MFLFAYVGNAMHHGRWSFCFFLRPLFSRSFCLCYLHHWSVGAVQMHLFCNAISHQCNWPIYSCLKNRPLNLIISATHTAALVFPQKEIINNMLKSYCPLNLITSCSTLGEITAINHSLGFLVHSK